MHSNNPINAAWNFFKNNTYGTNRLLRSHPSINIPDGARPGLVPITVEPSPILDRLFRDGNYKPINIDNLSAWQKIKATAMNDKGEYSKARIAGMGAAGYMGLSAAGRIASGGGLYRDSEGNFDVIGIPII